MKAASLSRAEDLDREKNWLAWLEGRLPVPELIGYREAGERAYLLLSEVPGRRACDSLPEEDVAETVAILGRSLRRIHALDFAGCPGSETLEDELDRARSIFERGWLDSTSFQAANSGRSPQDVYGELLAARHFKEQLVLTHGDYAMPNVLIERGEVSGILDWGNARIADPHRDFVVIAASLARNCGGEWMPEFLAAYGNAAVDPQKLRFYRLLDQFFSHYSPAALSEPVGEEEVARVLLDWRTEDRSMLQESAELDPIS